MIDMNVGIGQWPFWPTDGDTGSLERKLRKEGIERACAYPLEAYLWPDPQEANELRLPEVARHPFFIPTAVLDPTLGNALKSYAACREKWAVPLVRLFPCYHKYELSHEGTDRLAEFAKRDGVVIGVHLRAVDTRNRNPITEPRDVPLSEAAEFAGRHPGLQVIAFCTAKSAEIVKAGKLPDNLYIETSFLESEQSFLSLLSIVQPERLVMGTHAPIHYIAPGVRKLTGSGAPDSAIQAACQNNAARLLRLEAEKPRCQ